MFTSALTPPLAVPAAAIAATSVTVTLPVALGTAAQPALRSKHDPLGLCHRTIGPVAVK